MPIWLIELFGERDLDLAFVLIAVMSAPVWFAMILWPHAKLTRMVGQPLPVGLAYCMVLLVLLWKSYAAAAFPDPLVHVSYEGAQAFTRHPVAFLALFCNLQILNLVLGTVIYNKAERIHMRVPVELALCWLLGAVALLPFAVRLLIRRKSLS